MLPNTKLSDWSFQSKNSALTATYTLNPYIQSVSFIVSLSRAISHQPLTAQARMQSQVSPCEICGEKSTTQQGFLRVLRFSPCQYHPTNVLYSSACTCCSCQKDKEANPGKLPKKERSFVNGEQWTENYFHFFIVSLKHGNLIAQKSCIRRHPLTAVENRDAMIWAPL